MMDIPREIEKLRAMKVPGLVERYREVFDKEPRVKHKAWLTEIWRPFSRRTTPPGGTDRGNRSTHQGASEKRHRSETEA
jgi:hypothetical protein